MHVIEFESAQKQLDDILDRVVEDADYMVITRGAKQSAVLMSLDTFNSYMETFHLLRSQANATHLAESIEQYKSGKVHVRDIINE